MKSTWIAVRSRFLLCEVTFLPFYHSRLGILTPKGKQEIQITYAPEQARVILASVIFKFLEGEESSKVLKISAVGKFPFLTLSQDSIDFETLLVGKVISKEIFLRNNSLVPAHFVIEK